MNPGFETREEAGNRIWRGNDLSKVRKIEPEENAADRDEIKKRVGVYCRVSTDHVSQATSFELQKKYYVKYVSRHPDWQLVCLYSDEGISATSIKNRVGLKMMIRDAIDGKIDLIVVKSISRFCRNLGDSIRIIRELKSLSPPVGIFFETEGINSLDSTSDMIIKLLSMIAEDESKIKSETITASYRQRFGEGLFLVLASLGYRRCGVNKIEIDEEEAKTVRLIYKMYLAGYDPGYIGRTLVELGRKKHTKVFLDGTVVEGTCDWDSSSVLNVLDNEKRCGDVLAQKTYTFDCIDHIVRKNDRVIPQYYAVDQHPAIISREEYYLALKIKNANKGGWNKGLQTIRTYTTGALKGFVRVVPGWKGFSFSDYARAALHGYGVDVPEDSIYPDYVCDKPSESGNEDVPEVSHYYELVEEDFNMDMDDDADDYPDIADTIPEYVVRLQELRESLVDSRSRESVKYHPASSRLFYTGAKPIITIDRNGVRFNKNCYERLAESEESSEYIEVLFNPITGQIYVHLSDESDIDNECRMRWIKYEEESVSMVRCPAIGLSKTLYSCFEWDEDNRYKANGSVTYIGGNKYLAFDMNDPIVIVKLSKPGEQQREEEKSKIDIAVEEAHKTAEYYLDTSAEIEEYFDFLRSSKADKKSKAVYFVEKEERESISIADYEEEKYNPCFIKTLLEKGITPVEGWDYLGSMIKWNEGGFELMSQNHRLGFNHRSDVSSMELVSEASSYEETGWTTKFSFPEKAEVEKMINDMRRQKEERDAVSTDLECQ